jgi:hypothetical protein
MPESPIVERAALDENVTNGAAYERGWLTLRSDQVLVVPDIAVVEETDTKSVQFFVSKSLGYSGHPPHPIRIGLARSHYGIAYQFKDDKCVISTFGEWSNIDGSATIELLVLIPRGQKFEKEAGLHGNQSRAATPMNFAEPALKKCYWYAGISPGESWNRIDLQLQHNRFLLDDDH